MLSVGLLPPKIVEASIRPRQNVGPMVLKLALYDLDDHIRKLLTVQQPRNGFKRDAEPRQKSQMFEDND